MSDLDGIDLSGLWKDLCTTMAEQNEDTQSLKKKYQLLLRVVSVAAWKKFELTNIIKGYRVSASDFASRARDGVSRGLHYEERRLYELLRAPDTVQTAKRNMERVEIILEGTRRFEYILKSYFEVMKIDLKLSFEGHE